MRRVKVVWGLVAVLLASGCASTTIQAYRPKNPDEELVVSMLRRIPEGVNNQSLDLMMQPYAPDVYIGNFFKYLGVAGPDAPLRVSKAELRAAYAQLFKSTKGLTMTVKDFQLSVSGDRASAQARTELYFKIDAGRGEARDDTLRNDVTWRLRRTPNGWRIVEEIWE